MIIFITWCCLVEIAITIRIVVLRVLINHVVVVRAVRGRIDIHGERIRRVVWIAIGIERGNLGRVCKRCQRHVRDLINDGNRYTRTRSDRTVNREHRLCISHAG